MVRYRYLLLSVLFTLGAACLHAQLPQGFTEEAIPGPWSNPAGITFDQQGNGYLWETNGILHFIDTSGQVSLILDISEEAASWHDHGALGFALDPYFSENGRIYLLYPVDRHYLLYHGSPDYDPEITTTHKASIGRITRYTLDLSQEIPVVVPGSRKVLVGQSAEDGFPIYSVNHGVGSIAFGSDGTLLASCGDSANSTSVDNGNDMQTYYLQAVEEGILQSAENVGAFKSQLVDNLNGKLIRIDPETGAGLPSNPYYDEEAPFAARSRVWALGLRNPWRITIVPETGSHLPADGQPGYCIVGDVGEGAWEEINLVTAGGQNFGWPVYEGFEKHPEYAQRITFNWNAPNPLSGQEGCLEYFSYQSLLSAAGQGPPAINPCDGQTAMPAHIPVFEHQPPLIAYRNQAEETQPYALASTIDADGLPTYQSIEEVGIGPHFQGDASMSGVFYKSDQFPEAYRGKYFHGDYRGWIRVMDYENGWFTKIDSFHQASEKIIALAENPQNGALYYINLEDKKLYRIRYGGPAIPLIKASADPLWGPSPLAVSFDASQSYNPESPLEFFWDFGDGSQASGPTASHLFNNSSGEPEVFTIILTVRDTFEQERQQSFAVAINNTAPEVAITHPSGGSRYPTDGTSLFRLAADVADGESANEELNYHWEVFLHHNDHFHPSSESRESRAYALISPLGCHDTDTYWYRIRLSVSDPLGSERTDEILIHPDCEPPFIEFFELKGRVLGQAVDLSWKAHIAGQPDYYEIQRSYDFFHFESLGRIDASSSYPGAIDGQPLDGVNIYRVKAVAASGAVRYSPLAFVSYPPELNYRLYPNPAEQLLKLELEEAQDDVVHVQVYNAQGQLIFKDKVTTPYGQPVSYELAVEGWPPGPYCLMVNNGRKRIVEKVIKR